MAKRADLVGEKFNRLTVLQYSHTVKHGTAYFACWECICECGKIVVVRTNGLRNGHSKSCGCLQKDTVRKSNTTHDMTHTPEYKIWTAMKSRTTNKNQAQYKDYGGRGVEVCDHWLNSFQNFIHDMGKRPSPKHTIDRIDNTGDYYFENCRWATRLEQANNKRNNRLITAFGKTHTLAAWVRITGINYTTLQSRIVRGWTPEKALNYIYHKP